MRQFINKGPVSRNNRKRCCEAKIGHTCIATAWITTAYGRIHDVETTAPIPLRPVFASPAKYVKPNHSDILAPRKTSHCMIVLPVHWVQLEPKELWIWARNPSGTVGKCQFNNGSSSYAMKRWKKMKCKSHLQWFAILAINEKLCDDANSLQEFIGTSSWQINRTLVTWLIWWCFHYVGPIRSKLEFEESQERAAGLGGSARKVTHMETNVTATFYFRSWCSDTKAAMKVPVQSVTVSEQKGSHFNDVALGALRISYWFVRRIFCTWYLRSRTCDPQRVTFF